MGPTGSSRGQASAHIYPFIRKPKVLNQTSTKSSIVAIVINPRSGGFWSSSRHPAGEEIVTGGLYITMPASGVMRE